MTTTMNLLRSLILVFLFLGAMLFSQPANAFTDENESDEFLVLANVPGLLSSNLEEIRAGFRDPTGVLYRFAVDISAQVNDVIKFTRSIVMMPDQSGHLAATSNTTLQTVAAAADVQKPDTVTPSVETGANSAVASVIDNGRGFEVKDQQGVTTILNQLESGAISSVIVNTANARDIVQNIDISLVLRDIQAASPTIGSINNVNGLARIGTMQNLGFGL